MGPTSWGFPLPMVSEVAPFVDGLPIVAATSRVSGSKLLAKWTLSNRWCKRLGFMLLRLRVIERKNAQSKVVVFTAPSTLWRNTWMQCPLQGRAHSTNVCWWGFISCLMTQRLAEGATCAGLLNPMVVMLAKLCVEGKFMLNKSGKHSWFNRMDSILPPLTWQAIIRAHKRVGYFTDLIANDTIFARAGRAAPPLSHARPHFVGLAHPE